jgi:pimeloyl-ACP methyl ester carboxylesterase
VTRQYLTAGSGDPVTVFAHGLANSADDTRPLGSAVRGTRVFVNFSASTYAALAAELRKVVDEVGATRALGVSMGGGAILRLLADDPQRFERLVFFLPGSLDTSRQGAAAHRLATLAGAAARGDVDAIVSQLLAEMPPEIAVRREAEAFARRQASAMVDGPAARAVQQLPYTVPVEDASVLTDVKAPALVIAQRDDRAHPVEVAECLAAALPNATLHVFDQPAAMWTARPELRERISGFLNEP